MTQPLVSVIIPTCNAVATIMDTIASVQRQTYATYEIIVVDDGSTDGTAAIVKGIPGIKWLTQPHQGVSVARNRGVAEAGGEYIAFLDADDIWHPQKLELQVQVAAKQIKPGVVASIFTAFRHTAELAAPPIYDGSELPIEVITFTQLLDQCCFIPSSVLIPRLIWDKTGGFDPRWLSGQDRDLWLRIACHYPIYRIGQPLFYYRNFTYHDGKQVNLSHVKRLSGIVNLALIVEQWHPRQGCFKLPAECSYSHYRRRLERYVFHSAKYVLRRGDAQLCSAHWEHFSYVFGKRAKLIQGRLLLKKWSYAWLKKYDRLPVTADIIANLRDAAVGSATEPGRCGHEG